MKPELLQLIYAFFGSLGFALVFNLKIKRLIPAALGGLFAWGVFLLVKHVSNHLFIATFASSVFAALFSEILARLFKAPTTVFILPALIPLIPGSSLFYTMQNAVSSDWNLVWHYALETVIYIGAITLGLSIVSALFKMIFKKKNG